MTGKIISMLTSESSIMQEEFPLLAMGLNGIPLLLITLGFLIYKVIGLMRNLLTHAYS